MVDVVRLKTSQKIKNKGFRAGNYILKELTVSDNIGIKETGCVWDGGDGRIRAEEIGMDKAGNYIREIKKKN